MQISKLALPNSSNETLLAENSAED